MQVWPGNKFGLRFIWVILFCLWCAKLLLLWNSEDSLSIGTFTRTSMKSEAKVALPFRKMHLNMSSARGRLKCDKQNIRRMFDNVISHTRLAIIRACYCIFGWSSSNPKREDVKWDVCIFSYLLKHAQPFIEKRHEAQNKVKTNKCERVNVTILLPMNFNGVGPLDPYLYKDG